MEPHFSIAFEGFDASVEPLSFTGRERVIGSTCASPATSPKSRLAARISSIGARG